jgi:hypothetical protein
VANSANPRITRHHAADAGAARRKLVGFSLMVVAHENRQAPYFMA